jgi:hypothetical protein
MTTENTQKNSLFFSCEKCYFKTSKKNDYNRHLQTKKHFSNIQQQLATGKTLICEKCNKEYKDRTGLWRHRKKCTVIETNLNEPFFTDKEFMIDLIKNNTEVQKMMLDVIKNGTHNINSHNTINNTNNTTNNKTFNLNVYLNETCKNAMNITEFVNSINLNLEDLENTGRKGYIEGISNIFIKKLNNIEHHLRSIHCSDQKRETIYIKDDNNEWTKEGEDKPLLTKAIKTVANQNIRQIKNWTEKYPDCTKSDSKKNDFYLKIVSNSMNGLTEEESKKNINKIISNIAKEVVIDKS